ncbi:MAG: chemotaxis-specific protein-glutamate methyltransferase CheB [Clostridiales bacterium]|nr:chemotaxis-specific protein-glutamate methyltransferase CheB [Clostridiales bacterium]
MAKNILIIDDSALMRRVISDIIEGDKRFHVIGSAINGLDGLNMLQANCDKIDAVLLDINMPRMNGLEFLAEIKKQNIKTTVIVVSAITTEDAKETILALELGAFDLITKPEDVEELRSDAFSKKLLDCLEVATKLRWTDPKKKIDTNVTKEPEKEDTKKVEKEKPLHVKQVKIPKKGMDKLVAIACSTGGPKALHSIIPKLPTDLDAGVVIVQHMPEGFTKSLAERLNSLSDVPVKEAEDGDIVKKGRVYIAKGGMQLRIVQDKSGEHVIKLSLEQPRHGLMPCADIMYESLADTDYDEITCVVLTGMGSDGSAGIKKLSNKKNIHVIAQDKETCIVYGMPRMVRQTGLVDQVEALQDVSDAIIKNVGVR